MSKFKVAAGILVGLVLLTGGYLIGRGSSPPPPAPGPTGWAVPATRPVVTPQQTAPVTLPKGAARARSQGIYTGPGGVPKGFPMTETGAVEAATAYNHFFLSGKWNTDDDFVEAFRAATGGPPTDQDRDSLVAVKQMGMQEDSVGGAYAVTTYNNDLGVYQATVYLWHRRRDAESEPGKWHYFWARADLMWQRDGWRWPRMWEPRADYYGSGPEPGDLYATLTSSEKAAVLAGRTPFVPPGTWRDYADA